MVPEVPAHVRFNVERAAAVGVRAEEGWNMSQFKFDGEMSDRRWRGTPMHREANIYEEVSTHASRPYAYCGAS